MPTKKEIFNSLKGEIYCFADNLALCSKLLKGGAKVIQFRNKKMSDEEFIKAVREMLALVRRCDNRIFIINDRFHLALDAGADGVHVGRDDMDYNEAINLAPEEMIIGVSVDNAEEAVEAEQLGATYVGAGSVFPSATKQEAPVLGIAGLRNVIYSVNIPVVAIGGISLKNIGLIRNSGARYFAVISQINNSANIQESLKSFRRLIVPSSHR